MGRAVPLILLAVALAAGLPPLRPAAAQTEPRQRFAITVSTEWAPGSLDRLPADLAAAGCPAEGEATMLADLEQGLRAMAAQFYRFTGGQMAIDSISIYTGGERWEQANIRVLASRSYRPSAFVGGAVAAPTAYYSATGSLAPMALFYPAPVLLGRQWDGRGGRCGAWSAPEGWRTIATSGPTTPSTFMTSTCSRGRGASSTAARTIPASGCCAAASGRPPTPARRSSR